MRVLDTSGEVLGPNVEPFYRDTPVYITWSDLDPFTQGYVEALFASLQFFHMECPICEWDCIEGPPGLGALGACCPLCAEDNGRDVRLHTEARVSRDWVGTVEGPDDRKKGFSELAPETLAAILKDCAEFVLVPGHRACCSAADGASFWRGRQHGPWTGFPPLTPSLGDDGKVYLIDRALGGVG